jgi:hypothetical protein
MTDRPRCNWCQHLIKPKGHGPAARYCSASCRQRAYERRQLEKQQQAEIDELHRQYSWAAKLQPQPKLPPRRRPTRLKCLVCSFPFAVRKRGHIPKTCGPRCKLALALYTAYTRGKNEGPAALDRDITAMAFRAQRGRRYQSIIDKLLDPPEAGDGQGAHEQ